MGMALYTRLRAGIFLNLPSVKRPRRRVQTSMREPRQRRDGQAGEAAHQRAVDADVLQVRADVALELLHQLLFLPAIDLVLDEAADLRAVLLDQRRQRLEDLLVDPLADLAVGLELLAERAHQRRDALPGLRIVFLQILAKPAAELLPQAADVGIERGAFQQLVADRMNSVLEGRVGPQTDHKPCYRLVELAAQLVIAIAAHLRDLGDRQLDDLQRGALVERELQPVAQLLDERRALRHLGGDEAPGVLLRQQVVEAVERRIQQRVVALVLGEDVEQLRRRAGQVELADAGGDRALQEALHALVVDGAQAVGEEARRISRHGVGVSRLQQPAAQRMR